MAPTPSGTLHLGTAHTALFNYLFAKHHGGQFILRIDDTDPERSTKEFEANIMHNLRWLGLDWDEGPDIGGPYGPYRQSERNDIYRKYIDTLIADDKVYLCYCTPEELDAERKEMQKNKIPPKYSGKCRHLTEAQRRSLEAEGRKPVIRLKVEEKVVTFHDPSRGDISMDSRLFGDFAIARSDYTPLLMLASTIDDIEMKITHTIRGEDYINFVPRQILLFEALGVEPPVFAHKPFLYAPDGSKLSKRHGATSVDEFKDLGYLPETLVNFLALMGWAPGDDRELFKKDELIKLFDFDRVQTTMPRVNYDKMQWMNGVYVRELSEDGFIDAVKPFIADHLDLQKPEVLRAFKKIIPLIRERIQLFSEIWELVDFFFAETLTYDAELLVPKKKQAEECQAAFSLVLRTLEQLQEWNQESIEQALRANVEELAWKVGELFMMIRIAVTGKKATPPLFETMEVLGREATCKRLQAARDFLT